MMKSCVLHIGYPKTGTTTFQRNIVPEFSHLKMIKGGWEPEGYMNALLYEWEASFQQNLERHCECLRHCMSAADNQKNFDNKIFLLSEESLLSTSMFFRFTPHPFVHVPDPVSIARKLKVLFRDTGIFDSVKVVVTIRRQPEMLKSMYAQMYHYVYSKFACTKTFSKFLQYALEDNASNFIAAALFYNEIIDTYQCLFGKENVVVLVYEDLRKGDAEFFQRLGVILDIDASVLKQKFGAHQVNVKSSGDGYQLDERSAYEQLGYYRQRFFPALGNKIKGTKLAGFLKTLKIPGGRTMSIQLSAKEEKEIIKSYAQSNKLLSQRCGLGLERHGYF